MLRLLAAVLVREVEVAVGLAVAVVPVVAGRLAVVAEPTAEVRFAAVELDDTANLGAAGLA